MLVPSTQSNGRCSSTKHRKTLNAIHWRATHSSSGKSVPSSHVNVRYIPSPEKLKRMERLHRSVRDSQQQVARNKATLSAMAETRGTVLDHDLHVDLCATVNQNTPGILRSYPDGSFRRLFWEQQQKACSLKDRRSMKRDPLMIRWCLYLRHLSSGAYETLRLSKALILPSQRTLRNYTHYTTASAGFSTDVDAQLIKMANLSCCTEREKYVIIIADEMHIKCTSSNLLFMTSTQVFL